MAGMSFLGVYLGLEDSTQIKENTLCEEKFVLSKQKYYFAICAVLPF